MHLNFSAAIRRIESHARQRGVGFIATAATHWHALGVDAFVEELRAGGDQSGGVVLLMAHPTNGMLLGESNLPICAAQENILILQVSGRLPSSILPAAGQALRLLARAARLMLTGQGRSAEAHERLSIASPRLPDAFTLLHLPPHLLRNRQVEFVVLDEGLSSYLPAAVAGQVRRPDRVASRTGAGIREFELLLRRTYDQLHGVFSGRYLCRDRLLFQPTEAGHLLPNKRIAASYRAAAAQHLQPAESPLRDAAPLAIILPQPWSEIGETDPEAEANLFAEVASDLQARGFSVAIKPHPREAKSKYERLAAAGVAILTQGIPVETLFSQLRAGDLVLGHNTTSLLTAAALSEATAATLGEMMIEREAAGKVFGTFQQHFSRLAGDQVIDARSLVGHRVAA